MDPKDRLLRVLQGQKTDRVPCVCPGGMMNMVVTELMRESGVYWPQAHCDPSQMADLAVAVYERQLFENYGVPFCMTVEAQSLGAPVTLGDDKVEPHVTGYLLESVEGVHRLSRLDTASGRAKTCVDAIALLKQRNDAVPIIGNLSGPLSVASSLLEPVTFYKELRRKNAQAHRYMAFVTEQIAAFGQAQIQAGADLIVISDPSGTGEILGPAYFEQFAVPYLNRLIEILREVDAHVPVIVHICGNMRKVYKQLAQIQAQAISFDAIVSLKEAKSYLPDKKIMGNVSSFALEGADPEKIKAMTRAVLRNGTDILAPACGLGTQSPLSNIQAMLETAQEGSAL